MLVRSRCENETSGRVSLHQRAGTRRVFDKEIGREV